MKQQLRVLLAEDCADDAELTLLALREGGYEFVARSVDNETDYLAALDPAPEIIISDYYMPQFGAGRALALLQERDLDVPFIVVSGQVSTDAAVALMRAGAHDYVFKHDLARLAPAVQRELRAARRRAEQRCAMAALRVSEEKLRLIMENAGDLIVMLDTEGRRLYASASYQGLFDEAGILPGSDSFAEIHPADRERVRQVFRETVVTGVGQRCEFRLVVINRGVRFLECQSSVILNDAGDVSKVVLISRDVTERKQSEARIQYLAHSDKLTGLPNRTLLAERIGQAMAQSDREGHYLALLFIDLDHFKTINDSLGHEVGDRLLKQVAARLTQCMRRSDFLARLGGDEFLMALSGVKHGQDAAQVAQKIVASIALPCQVGEHVLNTSCSVGISIYPGDGQDVQSLMRKADMAMYHAKERGRNHYQFFSREMDARAAERLQLHNALQRALEREEFELHYQPYIEFASGHITGVEALIRWRHPELGLLLPHRFIPLAEETGIIVPIGEWVLRTACQQMKSWQAQGMGHLRIAVNLSARQFHRSDLGQQIVAALRETALPPQMLDLEITESMAMQDPERAKALLHELRAMGVGLTIDDFGTGYSSLSYLRGFPIRCLKIDRSFVDGIPEDSNDAAITRATIALAKSLGLSVIAEGVETVAQQLFLTQAGCEQGQGYLFGRPECAAAVGMLLRQVHVLEGSRSEAASLALPH